MTRQKLNMVPFGTRFPMQHPGIKGIDDPTGTICPKCLTYEVVYNGNYFCSDEENCGWALSEFQKTLERQLSSRLSEYRRSRGRPK